MGTETETREILFLNPVFKEMIWGGDRLQKDWGYRIPSPQTGECWAVSAHPHGDCTVREGRYAGKHLSELWREAPELFGFRRESSFPLLVKIIDAQSDLSIQVHPDDAYAAKWENGSLGKTECWYILDAPENASLVMGHNAETREQLAEMVRGGRWKEFLRYVPVKKGDFLQINPGTVHAITAGLVILETQQSSDITYRVYDYDRMQNGRKRELHIEKSLDVIAVGPEAGKGGIKRAEQIEADCEPNRLCLLIACGCYRVWKLEVRGEAAFEQDTPFMIMSVIEGEGRICGHGIRKGDHFILPNGLGTVRLEGNMGLIASSVCG